MPWFPNPNGGAPIQAATNPNPAGGSLGLYSDPSYTGPPPGGGGGGVGAGAGAGGGGGGGGVAAPAATVQSGAQQLGAGINSLLGAIASGNKQAFDEAVRQFNATFGLDQDKFKESVRQYNEGLGVTQAQLTGTYQGQQTQQAQAQAAKLAADQAGLTGYYNAPGMGIYAPGSFVKKSTNEVGMIQPNGTIISWGDLPPDLQKQLAPGWTNVANIADAQFDAAVPGRAAQLTPVGGQGQMTQSMQQQQYSQQLGAINAAAALQANPFRQQQVIGQLGRVLGGQGVAGFSAPNTVAGVGTQGGTGPNTGMAYMSQLIDDIRGGPGSQNSVGVQDVLNAVPTPAKINSVEFLRSAPSTQNMILQAQQERYGLDPSDSLQQIKNTLPQASFQSPQTFGQIKG